jgi:hypothetical protein
MVEGIEHDDFKIIKRHLRTSLLPAPGTIADA